MVVSRQTGKQLTGNTVRLNRMDNHMDDYIKRGLKKWAETVRPEQGARDQIMMMALSEDYDPHEKTAWVVQVWKDLFRSDLIFHLEREWIINHQAALRLTTYHIATNGHMVL